MWQAAIDHVLSLALIMYFHWQRVNQIGFASVFEVDPSGRRCHQPNRKETCVMPNLNVTYAEIQSAASQLKAAEERMASDLTRLQQLIENLVHGGYVTDTSSKKFEAAYTDFTSGATKMVHGLIGMGQYLDVAANTFQEADNQLAAAVQNM
jgi:WXG100 family type VII secretion target